LPRAAAAVSRPPFTTPGNRLRLAAVPRWS